MHGGRQWHIDNRLPWSIMHDVTHTDLWFAAHFTEQFVIFEFLALIRHDTGHYCTNPIVKQYPKTRKTFQTAKMDRINTHTALLRRCSLLLTVPAHSPLVLLTQPTFTSFLIGRFISGNAIYGNSRLFPDDVGNCRKLWIYNDNHIRL